MNHRQEHKNSARCAGTVLKLTKRIKKTID